MNERNSIGQSGCKAITANRASCRPLVPHIHHLATPTNAFSDHHRPPRVVCMKACTKTFSTCILYTDNAGMFVLWRMDAGACRKA